MLSYGVTETGAIRTIDINIDTASTDLDKDLREITAQKVKTLQREINLIETNAVIIKKRLNALANTFNSLSYEEKLRAEIRITKTSIQLVRLINKLAITTRIKSVIEGRLRHYDNSKEIKISSFII